MPYRVQPGEAIKRLTQELQAKQETVAHLEQEKEQLIYRQLLLNAVLDAFSSVFGGNASAEEQQLLLQLGGLNIQQGSSSSSGISCSASFAPDVSAVPPAVCSPQHEQPEDIHSAGQGQFQPSAHSMIAPEHDPLRPVMRLLPQPPLAADLITLQQLQQDHQHTVSTLAANINLLEQQQQQDAGTPMSSTTPRSSSGVDEAAAPAIAAAAIAALLSIQCALRGYWAQLNALLQGGREHLTHAFIISNVLTGEQLEQHHPPLYQAAAQQLVLSSRQQQRIVTALRFFRQLTEPAVLARQQLQQQLQDQPLTTGDAAASEAPPAAAATPQGGMSDDTAAPPAAAAGGLRGVLPEPCRPQQAVLQQQEREWGLQQQRQQQLSQLQLLLRKEAVLKHCASSCIQGCLTWKQMAQFVLACYPWVASPIALAQAVEALVAEQKQAASGSE